MKGKKGTCAVALLFAVIFVLAACEKKSRYGVYIVDTVGMTHVLATDKKGETMQDKYGNLIEVATDSVKQKPMTYPDDVYVTGENGEVVESRNAGDNMTYTIPFPEMIALEDSVETADFVMPIPKGWEQNGTGFPQITHLKTGTVLQGLGCQKYKSIEEALERYEEVREMFSTEIEIDCTIDEIELGGKPFTKVTYDLGGPHTVNYLYDAGGRVYEFRATYAEGNFEKVDVESIISKIKYR